MVFWHNAEQKIKFNKRTRSQHFSCNAIDLIHIIISCRSESEICYWRYLQYLRADAVAVHKGKEFICMQFIQLVVFLTLH